MKELSPAKINLFLKVVGKRPNGYHNLESIFIKLNKLHDTIEIIESDKVECEMGNFPQQQNLVYKVAIALKDKFSVKKGAKIVISKNIPMGAGLGGGSSNAGVALRMLRKLWQIEVSDHELANFSASFGADIPFFVHQYQSALVEGIGEIISPCEINKKIFILLVNPRIHVDTVAVFKKGFKDYNLKSDFANLDPWQVIERFGNDLEPNAISLYPEISNLINEIKNMYGCFISRMTGSGSTCFGIFENKKDLSIAAKYFAKTCWVHYEEINI